MESDTSAAEAALKAKLSRKRTKTGCLTCRKRRIKCGEERPVCKNCIKSKRQCEGYSQRVVFRPPAFDYRPAPHGGAHITFPLPESGTPYVSHYGPPGYDPAFYGYQEPPQPDGTLPQGHFQDGVPSLQGPPMDPGPQHHARLAHQQNYPPSSPAFYGPDGRPLQFAPAGAPILKEEPHNDAHHAQFGAAPRVGGTYSPPAAAAPGPSNWQQYTPPKTEDNVRVQQIQPTLSNEHPASAMRKQSVTSHAANSASTEQPSPMWRIQGYTPRPEYQRPIDYQPRPSAAAPVPPPSSFAKAPSVQPPPHVPQDLYANRQTTGPNVPSHFLSAAAVEAQDDDYYDVQSDDEMDYEDSAVTMTDAAKQRRLTQLLQRHSISVQEVQMRRYDTFIYDGILDHYRVDDHANPLRNRATAMVFAHFIAVTGPSLSIFERHVRNSSVLFSEGQIPFPQQGLWTYTLPLAALRHRGLLHAMLALASLHIARLQNASQTPSMQHYSWAVKRIRHCVGHPKKRLKVTTIAASMLLGFYEIMTADHTKWNMHLAGSKQLFLELEFGDMVRSFRRMKRERQVSQMYSNGSGFPSPFPQSNDELLDQMYDVDERLVSQIVGKEVQYEKHGHVMTPQSSIPPDMDLGKFAMLKDLWWWYCKQDVYQSIVSGNPLLLDYSRWSNCPPRAPLGKAEAVYGSVDHLMLLLGRIADFAARDRTRKLKQMEANGGQWRPPPGTRMPAPPAPPTPVSATNGVHGLAPELPLPPTPSQKPPELPPFFGMAPPPRTNVTMPWSYMPANGMPTGQNSPQQEIEDLEAATFAAKEEYGRLRAALLTFQTSLGDAFQPLSSEYQQELDTPFGKALFFRSYDIGCLWAIFHMATIIAIRSHPDMHPAAHAAAAIAAHETAFPANEIGRIAAGIVPGPTDQPLNPTLGATLCESCMPSFFAAIQYQSAAQRHATVMRMYNIAQRTGWGSIELIANGCETSWVKAAAAGRGPPYARVMRPSQSSDPRLNGSWELDLDGEPDDMDERDRRLVKQKPAARLNWAIGVIGVEEDVVMG